MTGFLDAYRKSLDYQAPRKKKYTRANQVPFLTKEMNKEIMTRSRLRNKFLRCKSDEIKKAYNEQRNRCVKLVRTTKKAHCSNLSIKDVNHNKKYWKIGKLLFSEKVNTNENITLVENNNISSEIEIAEKLNAFFSNIVKKLNIKLKEDLLCDVSDINDPVERAIQKYKSQPNIQMIKETFDSNKSFSFDLVSSDTIFKEISLDTKKATHSNDVPTKIVKASADLFSIFVSNAFNGSVISGKFLSVLKLADVKPVHKKNGLKKLTIDQLIYYLTLQKFLKDACIDKFQNILKLCYQNFNVVSEKGIAPMIVN